MLYLRLMIIVTVALLVPHTALADDAWTHRGATQARNSMAAAGAVAPEIAEPRFVAAAPDGYQLVGQSAPVVHDGRIFVYAIRTVDTVTTSHVIAFSEADGAHLWTADVASREGDSWSAPTIAEQRGLVLMPSGNKVTAISAATGQRAWQTTLGISPIVNGTVLVHGARAYVADHRPMSTGAKLYCLNLDPDDQQYADGAMVWSQPLMRSVGSEAAVAETSSGSHILSTDMAGYIRQFTPTGSAGWVFALPGAGSFLPNGGFNGGLAVAGEQAFAATYNFYGAAILVCINAASGEQVWSSLCERTDTQPIVTADTVYLSGGVVGYGSQPKIEAFRRSDGVKLWQWTTAGGWTMQPVLVGQTLYVGDGASANPTTPAGNLYALDLSKTPADEGFVKGHFVGAGSSPAYANGNLYTIGATGLHAFGPPVGTVGGNGPQVTGWKSLAGQAGAGAVGLDVVDGFIEPRLDGARTVQLVFSLPIDASTIPAEGALVIHQLGGPEPVPVDTSGATHTLDGPRTTLTFVLPARLPDAGHYQLAINTAIAGDDGASVGGVVQVELRTLTGDCDSDGVVATSDMLLVRQQAGADATTGLAARCDIDSSGSVTGNDVRLLRRRLNNSMSN